MVIAYGTPKPERSRLAASHCEGSKSPRQGESRIKLCPIDRRDYPPIAPAHRQDQTWGMHKEPAFEIEPNEKLRWLRRLDGTRRWQFLDDRRCCRCCGKSFTGRQLEIVGGTRPHGPLRLTCPTRNCSSTPADWLYLHETPGRVSRRRNGSQPDAARFLFNDNQKTYAHCELNVSEEECILSQRCPESACLFCRLLTIGPTTCDVGAERHCWVVIW